jgi:hypothetical protein
MIILSYNGEEEKSITFVLLLLLLASIRSMSLCVPQKIKYLILKHLSEGVAL